MVHWEHRYLLGTMIFSISGDVIRDFDEEYEAWSWLEREGWGLVAIEPPDPVRPGACKYYFKRQRPSTASRPPITAEQPTVQRMQAIQGMQAGRGGRSGHEMTSIHERKGR